MRAKTQKIAEELHKVLKRLALEEDKTLQEITEELITDGLKDRGIELDRGADRPERTDRSD